MKVVVTSKIPRIGIDALEDAGFEVVGNPTEKLLSPLELRDFVKGAEAIYCLLLDKINSEVLEAAGPQLKIVANFGVGFDNIDLKASEAKGVMVANTPSERSGQAVAEHTLALIFAVLKRVVESDEFARKGNFGGWKPEIFLGEKLEGKTVGLVGLGQIGLKAARMLRGLGLRVVYSKRNRDNEMETALGIEYMSLDNLLREADIVSLHVPLTAETDHLIDSEALKKMKDRAFLINTARGAVVDEAALVEALKSGKLAGAGLDVYEYEPAINPELCGLPNVVLTTHIASSIREVRDEMALMAAKNIIAALNGQKPPNLVN
jgi:glyoxylate reductase